MTRDKEMRLLGGHAMSNFVVSPLFLPSDRRGLCILMQFSQPKR